MTNIKPKCNLKIITTSILIWTTLGISAIPYNILAIALCILPVRLRHKAVSSWAILFNFLTKYLGNITYNVQGRENLIAGPAIIASNHQSSWETIAFAQIFPQHVWILKREILKIPFFGWTVATLSPIAIDRSKRTEALQQILAQGIDRIKKGFWILVFPEGTRAKPGAIAPFKTGVAKLAQAINLPIVPITHNAGYVLPRKGFLIYPGNVDVCIGEPIYPQSHETPEELILRIEQAVRKNFISKPQG